jgi:hypothetical protein
MKSGCGFSLGSMGVLKAEYAGFQKESRLNCALLDCVCCSGCNAKQQLPKLLLQLALSGVEHGGLTWMVLRLLVAPVIVLRLWPPEAVSRARLEW